MSRAGSAAAVAAKDAWDDSAIILDDYTVSKCRLCCRQ